MKNACKSFANQNIVDPNNQNNLIHLIAIPLEPELISVAAAFVDLQEARHRADYNLSLPFERVAVLQKIDLVQQAMADWSTIRNNPNAKVFLAALLLQHRWNR